MPAKVPAASPAILLIDDPNPPAYPSPAFFPAFLVSTLPSPLSNSAPVFDTSGRTATQISAMFFPAIATPPDRVPVAVRHDPNPSPQRARDRRSRHGSVAGIRPGVGSAPHGPPQS